MSVPTDIMLKGREPSAETEAVAHAAPVRTNMVYNSARNYAFGANAVYIAGSVAELQELVRNCRHVKAIGDSPFVQWYCGLR